MRELTPRQRKILQFIRHATRGGGEAPSYREIGARFGIASTNGVRDHLKALERKGHLRIAGRRRGVVMEEGTLPILGEVPAGPPSLAEEHVQERLSLPGEFGPGVYGLRVRGDSMTGAGIHDGDVAVIRPTDEVRRGDIAVVVIDDEATIKRVAETGKRLVLKAENPAYKPITATDGQRVRVAGKVVGIVRRMG